MRVYVNEPSTYEFIRNFCTYRYFPDVVCQMVIWLNYGSKLSQLNNNNLLSLEYCFVDSFNFFFFLQIGLHIREIGNVSFSLANCWLQSYAFHFILRFRVTCIHYFLLLTTFSATNACSGSNCTLCLVTSATSYKCLCPDNVPFVVGSNTKCNLSCKYSCALHGA